MISALLRADADPFADGAAPEAPITYPPDDAGSAEASTEENRSRWNAVRHGCMAKKLFPVDLQAEIDRHTAMLTRRHGPTDEFEESVIANMGRLSAQLERMQKLLVIDLQRIMDRAVLCWDNDRDIYVDKLIKRLARDPAAARSLARSKQGAEWLLHTWSGLAEVVEFTGQWTEDQTRLALDLLGVRLEIRDGYYKMMAESDPKELEGIITHEVTRLEHALKHNLVALDHAAQSLAAVGMALEEDAETKKLRKQEASIKLELRRARDELREYRNPPTAVAAGQAPVPEPEPESKPRPKPEPEPDLRKMPSAVVDPGRHTSEMDADPPARPVTSDTAHKFMVRRAQADGLEVPATETVPAQTMVVLPPFPGGDSEPEPDIDGEAEPEPGPAAARPPKDCVASNASRTATATDRAEQERRRRRAQEKKARKAARRNRR